MKNINRIACLSLVAVMTSCTPSGYYDSNGEYRAYGKSDSYRYNKPMAGTGRNYSYHENSARMNRDTDFTYTRAGYYDHNGYYIDNEDRPQISNEYYPPRGMCRVWFIDRRADDQPSVESCSGIRDRVPGNAYVIYGG